MAIPGIGVKGIGGSGSGGGGSAVSSVFGRTGDVVAVASDYDASQIDNDSSVTGTYVSDALDTLQSAIVVDSVFGRTGAVVATLSDYDASQIDNDSTVVGATVKDALETLEGSVGAVGLSEVLAVDPNTDGEDININGDSRITADSDNTSGYLINATLDSLTGSGGGIRLKSAPSGTGPSGSLLDLENDTLGPRAGINLIHNSSDKAAIEITGIGGSGAKGIVVRGGHNYVPATTTELGCLYHCNGLSGEPRANFGTRTQVPLNGGPSFVGWGCGRLPEGTTTRLLFLGGGETLTAVEFQNTGNEPIWRPTRDIHIVGMEVHIGDPNDRTNPEDIEFVVRSGGADTTASVTMTENDNFSSNSNLSVFVASGTNIRLLARKTNSLASAVEDVTVTLEVE